MKEKSKYLTLFDVFLSQMILTSFLTLVEVITVKRFGYRDDLQSFHKRMNYVSTSKHLSL